MHIQDRFTVWLTVLAGNVVVETETLVGVGIDRHEQAEEIAEPTNLERQVGRAIGVGPAGGGGGAPVGGGGGGDPGLPGGGGGGEPRGGGSLLTMRAELADDVGMYVAPTSQVEVVLMATTGYTVVVPYTVADEIAVIVCTFEVDCVTVTHGGVEVWVIVRVMVGMLSRELQKGVATCCS